MLEPSFAVAVMSHSPSCRAVIVPLSDTVAIDVSDDVHSIFLSVVLSGVISADNCIVPLTLITAEVRLRVMPVANVCSTIISMYADLPSAVAVIVALPVECAVTMPFWSTVATDSSLDDHVAVRVVEFSGCIFAMSCTD